MVYVTIDLSDPCGKIIIAVTILDLWNLVSSHHSWPLRPGRHSPWSPRSRLTSYAFWMTFFSRFKQDILSRKDARLCIYSDTLTFPKLQRYCLWVPQNWCYGKNPDKNPIRKCRIFWNRLMPMTPYMAVKELGVSLHFPRFPQGVYSIVTYL